MCHKVFMNVWGQIIKCNVCWTAEVTTTERHLRITRRYFMLLFEFLSLTFHLNFQLINFPWHVRILLYFSYPRPCNVCSGPRLSFINHPNSHNTSHDSHMLSFFAVIKTFSKSLGGVPGNFCCDCAAQFSKSWPYFRRKKCYFPPRPGLLNSYPFSELVEV